MAATVTQSQRGIFAQWRSRLFGEVDPVERQLADIAKQGAGPARIAHICSTALVVLFSAASFVALGSDTFTAIQTQWETQHSLNVPDTISLSVITLMVLAFDVGMVYAASMLRNLATRRAGWGEKWVHVLVMVSVAAIEGATYCYMAWRFERPADGIAWALIILRAVASPLLAVYLSMARALPVTARDIMAQAELASGAGVLRDITVEASDADATLADKLELYDASAVMTEPDRTRLERMTAVAQRRMARRSGVTISPVRTDAIEAPETPTRPPTGGGTPVAAVVESDAASAPTTRSARSAVVSLDDRRSTGRRATSGRYNGRPVRTASAEGKARRAWDAGARTVGEIVLKSASDPAGRIGRSAASKYRRQFLAEEVNVGEVAQ